MIRLKSLLEMVDTDLKRLLDKIKNKQFKFIGAGDNGRVYEINGEDRCFKITRERDEFEVATIIVGRWGEFTTFIPIYYVDDREHMYIMANAETLPQSDRSMIDKFTDQYKKFAYDEGGEVSAACDCGWHSAAPAPGVARPHGGLHGLCRQSRLSRHDP